MSYTMGTAGVCMTGAKVSYDMGTDGICVCKHGYIIILDLGEKMTYTF